MTCSRCGNPLAQGAHFCSACGVAISAQPNFVPSTPYPYPAPPPEMRVSRNLQALGIMWLVYAGLRAVGVLGAFLFLHGFFGSHVHFDHNLGWSPFGRLLTETLAPVAILSMAVSVGLTALTGYALLTRQPWGRIFAIVFAILALFHFPFGTALGIFTLWVMASARSGDEYAALSSGAQPA